MVFKNQSKVMPQENVPYVQQGYGLVVVSLKKADACA